VAVLVITAEMARLRTDFATDIRVAKPNKKRFRDAGEVHD
jgi:hypothetical protein